MKRSMNVILGVALSALVAMPAWAGSLASVAQEGDHNYSIVYQKGNKTQVKTWTATHPLQEAAFDKKVEKAAKRATLGGVTGKAGGRNRCGGIRGVNNAFALQSGTGNSASTNQAGANNIAGTIQDGNDNTSYIVQRGDGHEAYAQQYGNGNTSLIVQRC